VSQPKDFMEEDERFPELHDLLNSYSFAGNTFTDTAEEPGTALQAYVRHAVRTPGLLDAVIGEIDDLLQVGLFSDEIADDVDILPHIAPPSGRTVEQCLAIVRSHLERIRGGGTYENPRLPQTDWEWRKQFPEVSMLLGARFNQEFSRFYASRREALDDHFSLTDEESLAELVEELESLLALAESDAELDGATQILGLQVYPPEGVSLRQWLTDIRDIITHRLHTSAPPP